MPQRCARFCKHPGCANTVGRDRSFCVEHDDEEQALKENSWRQRDQRRGSSRQRGYDTRWSKYSKMFLSRPENRFCVLHLDERCAVVAQCVDHIDPPDGPGDPRFWDMRNHQPACIHCNSLKNHRNMRGTYVYGADLPERKMR